MTDEIRIVPVILSGGSGTRLWPMSQPENPKQLLSLTADESMLQLTVRRTHHERFTAPIIVANLMHIEEIETQLAAIGLPPQALLLEPVGRNTAPAIALAALAAGGASPLLVMPSDHVIADVAAFHAAIEAALPLVQDKWLITFGIAPDAPETGYGWISVGEKVGSGVHKVDHFVEKPHRAKAEAMLAAGNHVWNGGIFLFRADVYLAALEEYAPEILAAAEKAMNLATQDGFRIYPDAEAFAQSPSNSIDYAVMENSSQVAVVPVTMGWSDVGSWDALHAISQKDEDGNVLRGDVVEIDAANCFISADAEKRIALIGVSDLIVIACGDDVLILPRGRSQEIKRLLAAINGSALPAP